MSAIKRLYDRAVAALGLYRGELPADGGAPIQNVQVISVTTGGRMATVPFMQHYGLGSRPHAGCDYALLALGGDPTKSVIIASNDQRYRVSLVEGEVVLFDDLGQVVHLTRAGIVARDQYGNSFITSSTGIVLTDVSGSKMTMAGDTITAAPNNEIFNVVGQVEATGNSGTGGALTGDLVVTGAVRATGNITAGFGTADEVDLLGHKHNVTAVGAETSAPVPGT